MTAVGASASSQHRADGAHPVAEIEVLDRLERLVTDQVDAGEELQVTGRVSDDEEDDLALIALGHKAARDAHDVRCLGAGLELGVIRLELSRARGDLPAVAVWLLPGRAQCVELCSANEEGVVFGGDRSVGGGVLLVGHRASG